jgi:hypothetical protein
LFSTLNLNPVVAWRAVGIIWPLATPSADGYHRPADGGEIGMKGRIWFLRYCFSRLCSSWQQERSWSFSAKTGS